MEQSQAVGGSEMALWERCAFAIYDAGVSLVVGTVLIPVELIKIVRGQSRQRWLKERLGRHDEPSRNNRIHLLIHAVSVGEVHASGALISALKKEHPSIAVTLTTGNVEGRRAARLLQQRVPGITSVCYLPWDRRAALRRWLHRIQPDAAIIVETEIWPNLFRAAHDLSIPALIVSGRIYPRDVPRYRLARPFFRQVLTLVRWIGVQSEQERAAFLDTGAPVGRIEVVGNLKHDVAPSGEPGEPRESTLEDSQGTVLIVAGSTHSPEEGWLIEALVRLRKSEPATRMILAPRQPRRARAVRRQAEAVGLTAVFWSEDDSATGAWDVLVLDQVGLLPVVYRWADIAVIGGSLANMGGHNPMEAALHGRAIVMGPFHEHFRDDVAGLDQVTGIRLLPSAGDIQMALCSALLELVSDPRQRDVLGLRAKAFARSQQGVAKKYAVSLLEQLSSADS